MLHASQVPRGEQNAAHAEPEHSPSGEAGHQAEVLAEEAMGIDESQGDVPEPLYVAGEPTALLSTYRMQHSLCCVR